MVAFAFALLFMAAVDRVDVVMRTLRRVLIFSSEPGWDVAVLAPEDAGVVAEAAAALALGVPGTTLLAVDVADVGGTLWFRSGFSFSADEPAISINGSSLSDESSTVTEAVAGAAADSAGGVVVATVVEPVAAFLSAVPRLGTVFRCFSAFVTAAAATAALRGFLVRLGMIMTSSLTHDWFELSEPWRFRLPFGRVFGLNRSTAAAAVVAATVAGVFVAIAATLPPTGCLLRQFFNRSAAGESIEGLCRGGSSGLSSLLEARVRTRFSADSGWDGMSIVRGE